MDNPLLDATHAASVSAIKFIFATEFPEPNHTQVSIRAYGGDYIENIRGDFVKKLSNDDFSVRLIRSSQDAVVPIKGYSYIILGLMWNNWAEAHGGPGKYQVTGKDRPLYYIAIPEGVLGLCRCYVSVDGEGLSLRFEGDWKPAYHQVQEPNKDNVIDPNVGRNVWQDLLYPDIKRYCHQNGIEDPNVVVKSVKAWLNAHADDIDE